MMRWLLLLALLGALGLTGFKAFRSQPDTGGVHAMEDGSGFPPPPPH